MDRESLDKFRAEIFDRSDAYSQLHVGYFFTWFSKVELSITFLIAIVGDFKNVESFELLCRRMDIRVKIERLRQVCKMRNRKIGGTSNLGVRLDHLDNKIRNVRNALAHSAHSYSQEGEPRIFLATINRMPFKALGITLVNPTKEPDAITLTELFEHGLWLNLFAQDLFEVQEQAISGKPLEITNPGSLAPTARNQPQPHK